jgi:hypothetical protein
LDGVEETAFESLGTCHGFVEDLKKNIVLSPAGLDFGFHNKQFWFWVPSRKVGIKIGINLNCDCITLFQFLFQLLEVQNDLE